MRTRAKARNAAATTKTQPIGLARDASDREVAAYWDTHSVADQWDELEPVAFNVKPSARRVVTLRLDPGAADALRALARRRGTNYSGLARLWLSERLRVELRQETKKARRS